MQKGRQKQLMEKEVKKKMKEESENNLVKQK